MTDLERWANYLDLMKIRQRARQHDAAIVGIVFILAFLATFGVGMLSGLSGRELYLIVPVDALLGIAYAIARARLEITNEHIQLLQALLPQG
jgi:4-hydroxybenzoate polyprenyltransferase